MYFADDRAKVPVGEPGAPVSTGVRGKKALAPTTSTFSALDHDMSKASMTPSVVLECEIAENANKSFGCGTVTVAVNDTALETSSPMRHAAMLVEIAENKDKKIIMKFTDGGTDQRNSSSSAVC